MALPFGVTIAGAPRLYGHSDGDVVLHAVADALLGAAGLGDLGRLFPAGPATPAGIASVELLGSVVARLAGEGWRPAGVPEDQATEVEVTFETVGEETRVSVEHRGWDAVPQDHMARHGFPLGPFQMRAAEWWRAELAAMRALIAVPPP